MDDQLHEYHDINSVPAKYQQRHCTDVCCIILGILFSLGMVLTAVFSYNDQYYKNNFPTDSDGKLCGIDYPAFPYIYFNKPPLIAKRVCVSKCPTDSDTKLSCMKTKSTGCVFSSNPDFENIYYVNEPTTTRDGKFCFPKDQTLKQQLLENSHLANRELIMNSTDLILISMGVSLGVSIIYLLFTQFFPIFINYAAVILGLIVMIGFTVCIFIYDTPYNNAKWIVIVLFILMIILSLLTLLVNVSGWKVNGIFLREATSMVCQKISVLGYILLFMVLVSLFIIWMLLQLKFLWGLGELTFNNEKSLFHEIVGGGTSFMTVLWFVQGVWGLSFLKESFNFCISDRTVQWYYQQDKKEDEDGFFHPLKLILCKHLGSIIAGSFMTGFFSILDYIFDFLKPNVEEAPNTCYTRCFTKSCSKCTDILDLVRSDSMAYIALTGNPYCNSSRHCQYMCDKSLLMDNSQSVGRAYRIFAHFLIAASVALISLYLKGSTSLIIIGIILILSVFISAFFVSLHSDSAEAIMVIFLQDEEFSKRDQIAKNNKFNDRDFHTAFSNKKKVELAQQLKEMRLKQKEKEDLAQIDSIRQQSIKQDSIRLQSKHQE